MNVDIMQLRWVLLWKGYVKGDYPPLNDVEAHFTTIIVHH